MNFFFREKKPWIKNILRIFLFPIWFLLLLLVVWKLKYMLWDKQVRRLMKQKKYAEAFSFGFDRLSTWNEKESDSSKGSWPPFQMCWWMTFALICDCALEMNDPDILERIGFVFSKRPDGNTGYEIASNLSSMSRVAWIKGDREKAWDWINRAVQSDETFGYSYFLRAWIGEKLEMGQPLADLIAAVKNQPDLEKAVFQDESFLQKPKLLEVLKAELSN